MREAVGLFSDMVSLQNAVKELERTEFPRDALSVLGNKEEIEARFGSETVNPDFAMDDANTPREPLVRSEEKNIGRGALISATGYVGAMGLALMSGAITIPAIIAAAAIGGAGGAGIGAVLTKLLGDHFDDKMEDQIKRGGLLLWVRTPEPSREQIACDILSRYGATNVHVHDLPDASDEPRTVVSNI